MSDGRQQSAWLPILSYHSISESSGPAFRRYTLRPDLFREHLEYLKRTGYESFTISDVRARLSSGSGWPERSVALTFDDSFEDFYTVAFPMLVQLGMKATLFVPTAFVGGTSAWLERECESGRRMTSWSELHEIADAGIECGAHSHSHPQLDRLAAAELDSEIRVPKRMLEQQLGKEVVAFAYPFGYHSRAVRRAIQGAGYRAACAVGETSASSRSDPLAIPRLTVPHGTTSLDLARLLGNRAGLRLRIASDMKRAIWRTWRSTSRASRPASDPVTRNGD